MFRWKINAAIYRQKALKNQKRNESEAIYAHPKLKMTTIISILISLHFHPQRAWLNMELCRAQLRSRYEDLSLDVVGVPAEDNK